MTEEMMQAMNEMPVEAQAWLDVASEMGVMQECFGNLFGWKVVLVLPAVVCGEWLRRLPSCMVRKSGSRNLRSTTVVLQVKR